MENRKPIPYGGYGYRLFKHYVRFMHSRVFYRKVYYIGKENIPEQGVPVVFASNHQNCACDPLLLLLGLENESHPYVVARGDVFGKNHMVDRFFNWIGMVPAFRLNFDGAEALKKNEAMLSVTTHRLLEGNRLIIFPEGGHQDKHFLGDFSFGYTRLAFQAAEQANFEQDIVIVPCCNHYSDYFDVKTEALYRFGEPIHLQPYYERYKQKPRTVQREVNQIVRQRIEAMMLDIRDVENYEAIDFLRHGCTAQGSLPEVLEADKAFVHKLAEAQETHPEEVAQLYRDALALKQAEEQIRVDDGTISRQKGILSTLGRTLLSLLLLPLWIVSLWPNILLYTLPLLFLKTDKMFTNTWRLILSVVLGVPFFLLLTLFVAGFGFGWWWQGVAWFLLYPLTVDIAWYGRQYLRRTVLQWRLLLRPKQADTIRQKRQTLFECVAKICKA